MSTSGSVQRVLGLAVAMVIAVSAIAWPGTEVRMPSACGQRGHGVARGVLPVCCRHAAPSAGTEPARPPQPRGQSGDANVMLPLVAVSIDLIVPNLGMMARDTAAPRHGYHSASLSILLSTFLI